MIDQILADEQVDSLTAPGDVLWPLADNLGTVRDLAEFDAVSDTAAVVNHLTYSAFGGLTSQTNAAVDHLFGFTGRERDEESDLLYYRARYSDPQLGQFLSEDPIGFEASDANLRRYVGNNATNAVDPNGLQERHVLGRSRWELQEETARAYQERIETAGPFGAFWYTLGMQLHQAGNVMWTAWDTDVIEQRGERLLVKARNSGVTNPSAGRLTWEFTKDYVIPVDPAADAFVGFDRVESRFIEGDELVQRRIGAGAQLAATAAVGAALANAPAQALAGRFATASAAEATVASRVAGVAVISDANGGFVIIVDQALAGSEAAMVSQTFAGAGVTVMGMGASLAPATASQTMGVSFGLHSSSLSLAETDALASGYMLRLARGAVPDLPVFDGRTTHGVLVGRDGRVLQRFSSGNPNPTYSNYASSSHVEGKAGIWMRENGVTDTILYHSNPSGTCNWCHPQISTLLREGASLQVVPPAGTVTPPRWHVKPDPYIGNSGVPRLRQ